ncbi:MAG TPA: condensation domain-containing protein, partial [Methylomirabilota bacterium]|nr:condensation domain-containing protein [Methylomirabilota bacterium]
QYADFAVWQRERLTDAALAPHLAWWRENLAGAPPLLALPLDRPRPPMQGFRGGGLGVSLPGAPLRAIARRLEATPFLTLLAAWAAFLARFVHPDGADDLVVGTAVAGRGRVEVEPLIGLFAENLVLRLDLAGDPAFGLLVGRAREATLAAWAHQDVPFERLVRELRPERDLSHSPLFQVMVILQNAPLEPLELPHLTALPLAADAGTSKFDLRLSLLETPAGLTGSLVYNRDLFDPATVMRLGGYLENLLEAAVAHPELPLSALPLLGAAERHQVIEANDTAAAYPEGLCLHELIAAQAARSPRRLALTCDGEGLTYRELEGAANRLARRLQARGVGAESVVGVLAERSLEMVVGLLAVLKAGGAYLPLDPDYPAERLAFMLADSG